MATRVISDQLALWHGAYAGAYAASIEPDNAEAIQQAVKAESGLSALTVSTSRNDPYITVTVSKSQNFPLLIFGWSINAFKLHADVTIHIQDT